MKNEQLKEYLASKDISSSIEGTVLNYVPKKITFGNSYQSRKKDGIAINLFYECPSGKQDYLVAIFNPYCKHFKCALETDFSKEVIDNMINF